MDTKSDYDVIIIGAGIGGLTAGNILAKNGKKVLILEKNRSPGGAVSTFYRNGYPIDISHCICGMNQGSFIRKIFDYLDIYNKLEFIPLEKSFVFATDKTKPVICYRDFERYKNELKRLFPSETSNINKLFQEIQSIWQEEILKSYSSPNLLQLIIYLFRFSRLVKYKNCTFEQFLSKFIKSEELKNIISVAWPYLGLEKDKLSALYMICLMGSYHLDGSYFVKGGFGKIPETLAENLKSLNGEIIQSKVNKILLKNKTAYGVMTSEGSYYSAKQIISNADSKKTFLELVGKENLSVKLTKKIDSLQMSYSAIQAHIVAQAQVDPVWLSTGSILLQFDNNTKSKIFTLSGLKNQDNLQYMLSINNLKDFIQTEEGDTYIFNLVFMQEDPQLFSSFEQIKDENSYEKVKNQLQDILIDEIKRFSFIKSVKYANVLSPISMRDWLNTTEGAIYDASCLPSQILLNRLKQKTPIRNLYLVGAKSFPGPGMAGAFCSAVCLSDIILNHKLTQGKVILN